MHAFIAPLALEYLDGHNWRLLTAFNYTTDIDSLGTITVPADFITDFASIPRGLWNLFPPTGRYGKAAVIHDYLYRGSGVARIDADNVFREAMEVLQVPWLTRQLVYRAVRVFGRWAYQSKAVHDQSSTDQSRPAA